MFLFWGRYLRRHEQIGTVFHVSLFIISSVAAVSLYRLAIATLCGVEREVIHLEEGLNQPSRLTNSRVCPSRRPERLAHQDGRPRRTVGAMF
jgi:hypothetical protein